MSDIFVSYSHLDSDYAHKLVQDLEQYGFSAWIDERIDYGAQWPRVLQAQIDKCRAFIVIMTPRSYRSDWVHNELARARRKGKQIFPLLLEGEQWLSVETIQYVDVTGGGLPPPDFYERLAQVVSARAVEEDAEASNAQPEPRPGLTLLLSVRPKTVDLGEEARWTVTLRNDGDVDLTQVTARRGRTLLDGPFDLAAGKGRRFTFTTSYKAKGQRSRTATVSGVTRDGITARSAAGASVYVGKPRVAGTKARISGSAVRSKSRPSLALRLSVRPQPVDVGEEARWTVTLRNDGDVNLTQVTARRGRILLDKPFDLAVGRGRRFTFTSVYKASGKRTRKATVTGETLGGDSVHKEVEASVHVVKRGLY